MIVAELADVSRSFGATVALDGVDLRVDEGDVLALLGPNGAGKTTAIRVLLGLRRPDRGRALLFGADPRGLDARRRVGCTPQETSLPPALTVAETVDLVRAHYPRPLELADVLDRFGLSELARRQAGGLSGGQRRRAALALAFVGRPDLLVLDEPTTGLDAASRRAAWTQVRAHAEAGGAVLLTTHQLEEAEALATRIAVIAHGRIRTEGSPSEIRARAGLTRIRLAVAPSSLPAGTVGEERSNGSTTLLVHDVEAVVRELVRQGASLAGLEVAPASLEEALGVEDSV